MRKGIFIFLLTLACCAVSAQKIIFVPQWTPQAQFAGYYVAQEKGFFAEEGLDVIIRHVGTNSNETPADMLFSGRADIVGQQLFQSIQHRSEGAPLVNVFQLTHQNGLCCVARKPIQSFKDLDGAKICKWLVGYAEICEMLEKMEKIDITWVPCISLTNLFVSGAVDASLCYSYNELIQLDMAVGGISDSNIVRFSDDPSLNIPEDGLYVTDSYYSSNKEVVDKFVRASKRGWDYARENIEEALDITWKYIEENNILTNRLHEKMMLEEYFRLQINPITGKSDYAPVSESGFNVIVQGMLQNGAIQNAVEYKDFVK